MSMADVLVVDDEADIRALIQEILSDEGYSVTAAGDAEQADVGRWTSLIARAGGRIRHRPGVPGRPRAR